MNTIRTYAAKAASTLSYWLQALAFTIDPDTQVLDLDGECWIDYAEAGADVEVTP